MEHAGPGKGNLLVRTKCLQDRRSASLGLSVKRCRPQRIILTPWPRTIIGPVVFSAGAKSDEAATFIVGETSSKYQGCGDPIKILGCIPKAPVRYVPCTVQNMCRSQARDKPLAFIRIQ